MKQFTIRFETESIEVADAIFESIKTGKVINGIKVTAITNGDLFKRHECVEKQLDLVLENMAYELVDEEAAEYDELETQRQKTWERDIAKA